MSFELVENATGTPCTIYGVHKSGPLDQQTKFLIWRNGWRWVWANQFSPRPRAATAFPLGPAPVDLVVPPAPAAAPPGLSQVA